MTYDQAYEVLEAAPADSLPCPQQPEMTRREARDACRFSVNQLQHLGIAIGPVLEMSILKLGESADEDEDIPPLVAKRLADHAARNAAKLARFRVHHPSQATIIEDIPARTHRERMLREFVQRVDQKQALSRQHPAAPSQPKPNPKPDISSPTFVLKRPKRL